MIDGARVPRTLTARPFNSRRGLKWALGLTLSVAVIGFGLTPVAAAHADTVPAAGSNQTETVSSDSLPTVQVDGVVWSQASVGDTVYAGGSFASARPAGAAAGTQEVARTNLLAYNVKTGALITSFAPNLNGQVRGSQSRRWKQALHCR